MYHGSGRLPGAFIFTSTPTSSYPFIHSLEQQQQLHMSHPILSILYLYICTRTSPPYQGYLYMYEYKKIIYIYICVCVCMCVCVCEWYIRPPPHKLSYLHPTPSTTTTTTTQCGLMWSDVTTSDSNLARAPAKTQRRTSQIMKKLSSYRSKIEIRLQRQNQKSRHLV
jgi:hypothetical protein